ncbi:MAG: CPBP family intramembrane metalloprotease [Rhodobacteraceae bacterium]|nr:CPBP family intramembrane metalloprotease [Paracoccaceae bacterium]
MRGIPLLSSPLVWSVAAVVGSPILQLATGQGELYNFWLAVLMIGAWIACKLSKADMGVALGDGKSYALAVAYVIGIIGLVALGAWAAGIIDLTGFSAATAVRRVVLNAVVTAVLTLITEDGFFRGALWGLCARSGFSPTKTIVWTSIAFGLWHLMVPIIEPDFAQPLSKVPQYVIGSTVFGIAMGLLRLKSGSLLVPSVCHGLWNATVYTFFGAGEKAGLLGIADPAIWDPERGYAGLVLAIVAAAILWRWVKPAGART